MEQENKTDIQKTKIEENLHKPENIKTTNQVQIKSNEVPVKTKETAEEVITEKEAQKKFLELVKNKSNTEGKTLVEQGKELLNVSSMANLMTNEEFVQAYQEEQKKQIIKDLKEQGQLDAIKKASEKQTARNLRNDAFYKAFKPFFDNFMGIKDAFGLIPMIITVLVFYAPYILLSLVMTVLKFTFKGINEVFAAILEFKKPAKALCLTLLWLAISVCIILALIYGAQALFNFKII